MKIIDISMPISYGMPVYKGRQAKRPVQSVASDFKNGTCYETKIEMNLHTGTHLDSPLHMIEGGSTIEKLPLENVVTRCRVIDLTGATDKITEEDLREKFVEKGDFVLIKTRNSLEDILEGDFIYLDQSGARYLADIGVKGVGIDALGIERSQPAHETHTVLFEEGIIILEGLRLADVEEGEFFLLAAPIHIPGAEAAPVRALLLEGWP